MTSASMAGTHQVFNQAPELFGYDLAGADPVLADALVREIIEPAIPKS